MAEVQIERGTTALRARAPGTLYTCAVDGRTDVTATCTRRSLFDERSRQVPTVSSTRCWS